jgi:hypothetical protein
LPLPAGAEDAGDHLLGACAIPRSVAAADLARDDRGTDGLLGGPVGGGRARVGQEREQRVALVVQVLDEPAVLLVGGLPCEEAIEVAGEAGDGGDQCASFELAGFRARTDVEGTQQEALDGVRHASLSALRRLEPLAAAMQQVAQAGLVHCMHELAVRRPSVAREAAGEVLAEDQSGLFEAAAREDRVDRLCPFGKRA